MAIPPCEPTFSPPSTSAEFPSPPRPTTNRFPATLRGFRFPPRQNYLSLTPPWASNFTPRRRLSGAFCFVHPGDTSMSAERAFQPSPLPILLIRNTMRIRRDRLGTFTRNYRRASSPSRRRKFWESSKCPSSPPGPCAGFRSSRGCAPRRFRPARRPYFPRPPSPVWKSTPRRSRALPPRDISRYILKAPGRSTPPPRERHSI
jgi:hypothetical protein